MTRRAVSGMLGVVWVVMAFFLIYDSPDQHPRISAQELSFLEPYCMKKQYGKRVSLRILAKHKLLSLTNRIPIFHQYNSIPWKDIVKSGPANTLHISAFCFNWGFYTLGIIMLKMCSILLQG